MSGQPRTQNDDAVEIWDVIVVGAGPAGGVAAAAAAASGARTLLLEKEAIPRYKTCGGGLVGLSREQLPADLRLDVVHHSVTSATFTLRSRYRRTYRRPRPFLELVMRDELDAALLARAQTAGAEVETGSAVRSVREGADFVTVSTPGRDYVARAVVGADGSTSRIARYVGCQFEQVDLGLEAEIPVSSAVRAKWRDRILIDWGPLPGSYGWIFPKGSALTVGVIADRRHGGQAKAYFDQLVAANGLAGFPPDRQSGHLTRCRSASSPVRRGRVLVAGDAAGLLEPWTREGISFALRSGRIAGQVAARIAAGNAAEVELSGRLYDEYVRETLEPEMVSSDSFYRAFRRHPQVFHGAVWLGPAWGLFQRVVQGTTSLQRVLGHRGAAALVRGLARG